MRRHLLVSVVALAASASLPAAAQTDSDDQERYCTGDAFRLCSSEIPDVARITACMERRVNELSPACRAFFVTTPPPRASTARAKPPRPPAPKPETN